MSGAWGSGRQVPLPGSLWCLEGLWDREIYPILLRKDLAGNPIGDCRVDQCGNHLENLQGIAEGKQGGSQGLGCPLWDVWSGRGPAERLRGGIA
jgi:hypothetical protein